MKFAEPFQKAISAQQQGIPINWFEVAQQIMQAADAEIREKDAEIAELQLVTAQHAPDG